MTDFSGSAHEFVQTVSRAHFILQHCKHTCKLSPKSSPGSSLIIFCFCRFLAKHVNINRNQQRTTDTFDVVYFILLIFRI